MSFGIPFVCISLYSFSARGSERLWTLLQNATCFFVLMQFEMPLQIMCISRCRRSCRWWVHSPVNSPFQWFSAVVSWEVWSTSSIWSWKSSKKRMINRRERKVQCWMRREVGSYVSSLKEWAISSYKALRYALSCSNYIAKVNIVQEVFTLPFW